MISPAAVCLDGPTRTRNLVPQVRFPSRLNPPRRCGTLTCLLAHSSPALPEKTETPCHSVSPHCALPPTHPRQQTTSPAEAPGPRRTTSSVCSRSSARPPTPVRGAKARLQGAPALRAFTPHLAFLTSPHRTPRPRLRRRRGRLLRRVRRGFPEARGAGAQGVLVPGEAVQGAAAVWQVWRAVQGGERLLPVLVRERREPARVSNELRQCVRRLCSGRRQTEVC